MHNSRAEKVCFVFTKQFPFGIQEAYLLDEAPFLASYFDKVYYVPHAEFKFDSKQLRIELNDRISVININSNVNSLAFLERCRSVGIILAILISDFFTSREKGKTIRRSFQNMLRLYHYYASSRVLASFIDRHREDEKVFYHYWLHDGLIIQKMVQGIWNNNLGFTIARAHSLDLYHKNWPLKSYLPYERIKFFMADHVTSISHHGWQHMVSTFPSRSGYFSHRPLGVIEIESEINEEKIPDSLVVTVSWVSHLKRLDRVLKLMTALPRNFKWIHIGSGDEVILANLELECQKRQIQFEAKGYLPKPEVYAFFKCHKVAFFCNMSIWEGVPVSLMESAMLGIPMIVSDIPGNREIVNEENGWVVNGDEWSEELITEILSVSNDPDRWKNKSRAARKTFDLKYNALKNYTSFYDFVMSESAKFSAANKKII
jgi:glycosyltransferase involved in cell wall biosynthesis